MVPPRKEGLEGLARGPATENVRCPEGVRAIAEASLSSLHWERRGLSWTHRVHRKSWLGLGALAPCAGTHLTRRGWGHKGPGRAAVRGQNKTSTGHNSAPHPEPGDEPGGQDKTGRDAQEGRGPEPGSGRTPLGQAVGGAHREEGLGGVPEAGLGVGRRRRATMRGSQGTLQWCFLDFPPLGSSGLVSPSPQAPLGGRCIFLACIPPF